MHGNMNRGVPGTWRSPALWFAVGLTFAAATPFVISEARSFSGQSTTPRPKLVVERTIDLGRIDLGQTSDCRFRATNVGDAALVIHEASASCRCQGIYHETQPGRQEAVNELTLQPGESVDLGVGFIATGELNQPTYIAVNLSSNDPDEPVLQVQLKYTPTAKLYCVPHAIVFGIVSPGSTATKTIDVFADSRARTVDPDKLTCTSAELFSVRYRPKMDEKEQSAPKTSVAVQIGLLDITLISPLDPQTIDRPLVLLHDGDELLRLPVSARVAPDYELLPSALTLPRRSTQGDLFSFRAACRSRTGEPFEVRVKYVPRNFDVRLQEMSRSRDHTLTVTYTGDRLLSAPATETVVLTAVTPERSIDLYLQVAVVPSTEGK